MISDHCGILLLDLNSSVFCICSVVLQLQHIVSGMRHGQIFVHSDAISVQVFFLFAWHLSTFIIRLLEKRDLGNKNYIYFTMKLKQYCATVYSTFCSDIPIE